MVKTFTEKRFFYWTEDDISITIRHCSASYGGGSEVLIVCVKEDDISKSDRPIDGKRIPETRNTGSNERDVRDRGG